MATISAISGNTSLMYQIAAKGLAADSSSSVNYADLLSGDAASAKVQKPAEYPQFSSPAAVFTKSQSVPLYNTTAATSFISSLNENKSSLNDVLTSYRQASDTFNIEYRSITSSLKNSAKALASSNFNVKGATDTDTADNISAVLKNVNQFVNDYNETVSLFSDYSGLSKRLSNMSSLFSDNSARASGLASIGIKINSENNKLSVDTEKLTAALQNTPSRVEYQLGSFGLSGKAQSKLDVADAQKDRLFPSITEMAGDSYTTSQALYSGNALSMMNKYSAIGNFMDLYF